MEHKISFFPAWDKYDRDPKLNYGVGSVDICFFVIGDSGVVEFELGTNWYLPAVIDRRLRLLKNDVFQRKQDFLLKTYLNPFPLDVCYFSLIKISEESIYFEHGTSHAFDHSPCYYGYRYEPEENGVYTTDYVYHKLLTGGDRAVWDYLNKYYIEIFGNDDE